MKDTLNCLEMGAVDTLIVWENLDLQRLEVRNDASGDSGSKIHNYFCNRCDRVGDAGFAVLRKGRNDASGAHDLKPGIAVDQPGRVFQSTLPIFVLT